MELLGSNNLCFLAENFERRFFIFNRNELNSALDSLIADGWIFKDGDGNVHLNIQTLKRTVSAALSV